MDVLASGQMGRVRASHGHLLDWIWLPTISKMDCIPGGNEQTDLIEGQTLEQIRIKTRCLAKPLDGAPVEIDQSIIFQPQAQIRKSQAWGDLERDIEGSWRMAHS